MLAAFFTFQEINIPSIDKATHGRIRPCQPMAALNIYIILKSVKEECNIYLT